MRFRVFIESSLDPFAISEPLEKLGVSMRFRVFIVNSLDPSLFQSPWKT